MTWKCKVIQLPILLNGGTLLQKKVVLDGWMDG